MKSPRAFGWIVTLLVAAILLFGLTGCTQEQVERAEQAAITAREILTRAEAAEAKAREAVAMARKIADQVGNEQAQAIVTKAENALATVENGVEAARLAVRTTEQTAEAAKAAHAAGGSTVDVIAAVVGTAVPSLGALIIALRKLFASNKALTQTVRGVDEGRKQIDPIVWKEKLAPILAAEQDDAVKAMIDAIQEKNRIEDAKG